MTRRSFRPLQIQSATPTADFRKSHTTRRKFKTLQGGKTPKLPPIPGTIYRTMTPSSVADYEGISDSTWSSGNLGTYTVGTGSSAYTMTNWNCLYFVYKSDHPQTTAVEFLLNPVRWTCDVPTVNGGNYDWWQIPGPTTSNPPTRSGVNGHYGGLVHTILPSSGASHIALQATTRVHVDFFAGPSEFDVSSCIARPKVMGGYKQVGATYNNRLAYPTLEAVYPTTIYSLRGNWGIWSYSCDSVSAAYFRHRVNGSAVGSLNPIGAGFTPESCDVALADGDQYAIDIWYRVKVAILPSNVMFPGAAKGAIALPINKVSNNSQRTDYPRNPGYLPPIYGDSEFIEQRRTLGFSGVDISPNFVKATHTYQLTIPGGLSWTLPGGTTGPEKIADAHGWSAQIRDANVLWYNYTQSTNPVQWFYLTWENEIAELRIKFKTWFAQSEGFNINNHASYTPQSDGTYRTSTVNRNESLTITHVPSGCFNQGGTTTFALVEWTPTYCKFPEVTPGQYKWTVYEGKRSGVLPFYPNIPATVTVTRTTR